MSRQQQRDYLGRWLRVEPDAPGSVGELLACILIVIVIAAGILL